MYWSGPQDVKGGPVDIGKIMRNGLDVHSCAFPSLQSRSHTMKQSISDRDKIKNGDIAVEEEVFVNTTWKGMKVMYNSSKQRIVDLMNGLSTHRTVYIYIYI